MQDSDKQQLFNEKVWDPCEGGSVIYFFMRNSSASAWITGSSQCAEYLFYLRESPIKTK